ncbi:apolipoprotein N-acyltransferase [uncultured Helicobacter sp.]|uniref:apolipoprotein N-acyltransferase n=1 Tax=uncultured Helicobacter sp. TaxID=175537 RepID=UPI00261FDD2D|nr:apolipoprotein N-acyltransferase [uncultured Helicobacter sp.]
MFSVHSPPLQILKGLCFKAINIPCTPFMWRNPQTYKPTLVWLAISFGFAFICVLPFYMQWLLEQYTSRDISPLLASFLGILSVASVLFTPANRRFSVGFFIGVLWFYWISLGVRYFDMSFLVPLIVVAVGIFMGFVFYIVLWCECLLLRFIFLLLLSFFTPLGFDWIMLESVFAYSYFGVDKLSFALIILGLWLLVKYTLWWRLIGVVCLTFALDSHIFNTLHTATIPLKMKLIQSDVSQDFTYRMEQVDSIFMQHIEDIAQAKNAGYDMVVLPESAFYVPFDVMPSYYENLLALSEEIVILTGALRVERDNDNTLLYFNSTFKFDKGEVSFYDKVLLVPFGEYIPSFLLPLANIFFQGIGGFSAGEEFGYFDIKGVRLKNAICYEGTNRGFYKDNPRYVIVTSNNAWFVPSIEPILQKNLMKYYARLHNSVIFHATNRSSHAIITP